MSYVNLFEVQVTNFPAVFPISGTVTALQGTSPWVVSGSVSVSNFPAVQPVSQSGTWSVGRTWTLSSSTDSVNIGNFPSSFSVTQGTSPWVVSGTVSATQSGTWNINNITGTVSLPTGASTSALQTAGNASLVSIDSKLTSPIAVSQSGAWTTGRTWTLSSGTDSVSIGNFPATVAVTQSTSPWVISGTVTANAGTNLNTSLLALESGGNLASIKTNTDNLSLAQASTTSGQKGNLIMGAVTTAAPSYSTGQTDPLSLTTAGLLRVDGSGAIQPISGTVAVTQSTSPWVVSGTVAATQSGTWTTGRTWTLSSGTDSVNIGNFPATVAVTQSTSPWVVSGTITANQGGAPWSNNITQVGGSAVTLGQKTSANSIPVVLPSDQTVSVTVSSTTGVPASYSAAGTFTLGATPTDIFTIYGSGTKTVQIKKIHLAFTNTLNTNVIVAIQKRSSTNTGGTSTVLTATPFDSADAAATTTVREYTANPAALGTQVGSGICNLLAFAAALGSTNVGAVNEVLWGTALSQPIVLRGTSEGLAVNLGGATITGVSQALICVEWTEL